MFGIIQHRVLNEIDLGHSASVLNDSAPMLNEMLKRGLKEILICILFNLLEKLKIVEINELAIQHRVLNESRSASGAEWILEFVGNFSGSICFV